MCLCLCVCEREGEGTGGRKVVFFVMQVGECVSAESVLMSVSAAVQVCKAGMHAGQSRKIWLTRHGEGGQGCVLLYREQPLWSVAQDLAHTAR